MKRIIVAIVASLCFVVVGARASAQATPFKSGDVVCWVGDSITHFGTYPAQIQLFYETRFPDRAITYFNCGINGDAASPMISKSPLRIDSDILGHKPTVCTIMLGMNDIGRGFYDPNTKLHDPEGNKARQLNMYDASMQKLIADLQHGGARVILLTPSPYDDTMVRQKDETSYIAVGANDALKQCASKMKDWARQYHCDLVDFQSPMNAIDAEHQKADPSFSIVGKDRIHPQAVGQLVMAYAFLKDSGITPVVAEMSIDFDRATSIKSNNCDISEIKRDGQKLSFTSLEKALPFPVTEKAKPALELIPFTKDLNQETLAISTLPAGHWKLTIDDVAIGSFDAQQLADGINLAVMSTTPQSLQAAGVMQDMESLHALVVSDRYLAQLFYGHYNEWKIDPATDRTKAVQAATHAIDDAVKAGKPPQPVWKTFVDDKAWADHQHQEQALTTDIDAKKIPRPHHYLLAPDAGSN